MTNAAATAPNVRALVYVAAFAPEIGEDVLHLAGAGSMIAASIEPRLYPPSGENDVELYISLTNFREVFAGDIPAKDAAVMAVSQRPTALAAGIQPSFATAWRTIPSWYLLATEDNTITPEAQRFMAERAGAIIREVKSSHVVMISKPNKVVDIIEDAVDATE